MFFQARVYPVLLAVVSASTTAQASAKEMNMIMSPYMALIIFSFAFITFSSFPPAIIHKNAPWIIKTKKTTPNIPKNQLIILPTIAGSKSGSSDVLISAAFAVSFNPYGSASAKTNDGSIIDRLIIITRSNRVRCMIMNL